MKVRILSGNQTGAIQEVPKAEAEALISTGFAEAVDPEIEIREKAEVEAQQKADHKAELAQEREDREADKEAEEKAEDRAASRKRGR